MQLCRTWLQRSLTGSSSRQVQTYGVQVWSFTRCCGHSDLSTRDKRRCSARYSSLAEPGVSCRMTQRQLSAACLFLMLQPAQALASAQRYSRNKTSHSDGGLFFFSFWGRRSFFSPSHHHRVKSPSYNIHSSTCIILPFLYSPFLSKYFVYFYLYISPSLIL